MELSFFDIPLIYSTMLFLLFFPDTTGCSGRFRSQLEACASAVAWATALHLASLGQPPVAQIAAREAQRRVLWRG